MTTHITKTWFDGDKVVTQEITASEFYMTQQTARVQPADDLSDVLKRADVLYQKIGQQWLDLIPRIYSQARADKIKEKNT
jgi:hypothetical protein